MKNKILMVVFTIMLGFAGSACAQTPTDTPTPVPTYPGANPPTADECFIYPSPARGADAAVCYFMEKSGQVEIKFWNQKAGWVARYNGSKPSGVQVTTMDITGLPTGVYFYIIHISYNSGETATLGPRKFLVIHP